MKITIQKGALEVSSLKLNLLHVILLDAVSSALDEAKNVRIHHLAVNAVPRSGSSDDLLKLFKLDAKSICERIKEIVS